MLQRLGVGLAATSILFLAPTLVSAQSIGGTVTDESGAVLPGVTIDVRSPALIEQVRTAVSDGAGQYLVVSLEPGTYSVTFSLAGFSTFVRDGIGLVGEVTATVDGLLQVGSIAETITVTGAAPVVDVQNVNQTAVMTREVIDAVPTGKNFNNLAVLVPGMTSGTTYGVSQDVGGQSGQNQQQLSIHGGQYTDQRILVDGMAVNTWWDEADSTLWLQDGNFEEIQINHSAASAETETGGVSFNMIPRAGGNTFSSRTFLNFSAQGLQTNNVNQSHIDAGLLEFEKPDGTVDPAVNRVKDLWSINPSIGGPIVRDRLWFFGSYTRSVANAFVAFLNDADPNALTYSASNDQTVDDQDLHDVSLRLTAQATTNNKFQFYFNRNVSCHCHFLVGTAIGTNVMESGSILNQRNVEMYQGQWTSTLSNRLLIEAAFSALPSFYPFEPQANVDSTLPGVIDAGLRTRAHRGVASWYPPGRRNWLLLDNTMVSRGSLSYVTGSHSLKVGTSITRGNSDRIQDGFEHNAQIINLFGSPFSGSDHAPVTAVFNTYPLLQTDPWEKNYVWNIGTYAQDQWTLDRLTVNAGLRWDYFRGGYPDGGIPDAPWAAAKTWEGADPVVWNDLSPRLGLVYDLRGDGRTALKATANRYVAGAGTTLVGNAVNPALLNSRDSRFWLDGADGHPGVGVPLGFGIFPGCIPTASDPTGSSCIPGDGIAQCDPRIPSPNGECLAFTSNSAFGTLDNTTSFDPNWAEGFGKRWANWEFSGGIQHELTDGLSLNVTYFRRIYVNYAATNNTFQNSGDFDDYCVTVPNDPRLPNAGEQRCGYYDINSPLLLGQINEVRTSADDFGQHKRHWNGVDVTVNARMANGLLLQGGLSSGRTSEDDCDLNANLNNPAGAANLSQADCNQLQNFQTQLKVLGSYTLPYDIQIAGTLQSLPGSPISAAVRYTATETTLGRPFSGGGTQTLQVVDRGTLFAERVLQFDLRLTKILAFGPSRIRAMLDIYNVFNDSTVMEFNNNYGSTLGGGVNWLAPQLLIPGRLLKFAFQFDF